jgi:hypothetical protein
MCLWGSHRYISPHEGVIPQNPSFCGRQWGFPAQMFMGVSQHSRNVPQRLMAQNAHLGKTHNVQSEKARDEVILVIKFTKVYFKGKFTAKFQRTVENVG